MNPTQERIILTGASGFVGGRFLSLYKSEFEIRTVNLREKSPAEIDFSNIDCVLHCAALVHQMNGAAEEEYFRINFELTKNLAECAKKSGVKQFVFLSTAHVFGDSGTLYDHAKRLTEDAACQPKDAYGKSKLAAEKFLLSMSEQSFKVAIVRPPMIYGNGAKGNINSLIKLVRIFPILPLGFRDNRRSVVFIENLCFFLKLVIKKNATGLFLAQDALPVSLATLLSDIALAIGKKTVIFPPPHFLLYLLFKFFPDKSIRLFGTLALDSTRSNKILNYQAPHSTAEGLKKMLRP